MYYIGVDLGGTNIVVGLVNEDGVIVDTLTKPTERERDQYVIIDDMARLCLEIVSKNNLVESDIKGIGVGSPGTCNDKECIIVYANNIRFDNANVREAFAKHTSIPVHLGNDANCAALGEYYVGAGLEAKSCVVITLGTGVGGGIVVDGKLITGSHYNGAEIGHTTLQVGGEPCGCGRTGCFEAYCSATALIREINKYAKLHPESKLNDYINGNYNHTNAKMVFDARDEGDEVAAGIIDRYINYLAEGIANVNNIFDPDCVILGGGVSAQGEKLIAPLTEKVAKLMYGGVLNTAIVEAKLGNDAGIIGAAMLAK